MLLDELADDTIDPSNRAPLHRQLSQALRSRITDGSLPAGTLLPTEAELQRRFGISRSVVRQALLALTDEGLVHRSRGRGSVVAPRGEHHRLVQRVSGLSTQLAHVSTEVLSVAAAVGPEWDATAEAALGGPEMVALRRVRSAEGEPIALIHTWLPSSTSSLSAEELTDASLHATLRRRFDIAIVGGRRQVRAVASTPAQAEALRVQEGTPLLVLEGTSVDQWGTPVEYFRTWHRADRIVFDIDVVQNSEQPTGSVEVHTAAQGSSDASGGGPAAGTESGGPESESLGSRDLGSADITVAGLRAAADRARELAAELTRLADRAGE